MGEENALAIAGAQFNRISRLQLHDAGLKNAAIDHRIEAGRLLIVEHGVLAFAPALDHDPWGRWMSATLANPGDVLSHLSSAVARELLSWEGPLTTVSRSGSGGPTRHGRLLVHRSDTLAGEITE